jgi:hypothetical protein
MIAFGVFLSSVAGAGPLALDLFREQFDLFREQFGKAEI